MKMTDPDAIMSLPSPDELRKALARRVREAEVIRRLLKISEYAATELHDHRPDGVLREVGTC